MLVEGTLSIIHIGTHCGVRFVSTNPHTLDRQWVTRTDTDHLDALLRRCGVDAWSIARAQTELQHRRCAVLFLVVSAAQVDACFSEVEEPGRTTLQEQDASAVRQVRRTSPHRGFQPEPRFDARR